MSPASQFRGLHTAAFAPWVDANLKPCIQPVTQGLVVESTHFSRKETNSMQEMISRTATTETRITRNPRHAGTLSVALAQRSASPQSAACPGKGYVAMSRAHLVFATAFLMTAAVLFDPVLAAATPKGPIKTVFVILMENH